MTRVPHTTRPPRRPHSLWLGAAACALICTNSAPAIAQSDEPVSETDDVIVVLGSLRPRPASEIGSAISVLSADDLELRQINLVSDALRDLPGVSVNRAGPQGSLTQVRIRGAEGNHTLVYIDGVEVNNPVDSEFNFANLISADIEQLEVIRGPQSALYGSEAIGGVISVITKTPTDSLTSEAELEYGSFNSYRAFAAVGAGTERGGVRGAVQFYQTDGFSASPDGPEEDGFENLTASVKGLLNLTSDWRLEAVARVVDSSADTDAQEFSFGTVQDALTSTETNDLYLKFDVTGMLLDGLVTPRAFVGFTRSEIDNLAPNAFDRSSSKGERLDYGVQTTTSFGQGGLAHTLTGGVEREEFDFVNENPFIGSGLNAQTDEQTSLVGEYNLTISEQVFLSGAVRQDINDVFENATTYRLAGAYRLRETGTRFHASWGEGVTDPTFSERFGFDPGTFVGNPALKPERSQGWDIGIEQVLLDGQMILDATYFNADLEDEITTVFDFTTFLSSPINQDGESKRSGVELTLSAQLYDGLTLDGAYTYLDATGGDGLAEVRRPSHMASADLVWDTFGDRGSVNLGVDYNGAAEDSYFGFADPNYTPRRDLNAYATIRLGAALALSDKAELFARGENLLDEDYQEVLGFASPGRAGYVGVRLNR